MGSKKDLSLILICLAAINGKADGQNISTGTDRSLPWLRRNSMLPSADGVTVILSLPLPSSRFGPSGNEFPNR